MTAAGVIVRIGGRDFHAPDQPTWTCSTCGHAWPCDPARERLAGLFGADLAGLSVWLGAQLGLAAAEIYGRVTVHELFERFVEWPLRLRGLPVTMGTVDQP